MLFVDFVLDITLVVPFILMMVCLDELSETGVIKKLFKGIIPLSNLLYFFSSKITTLKVKLLAFIIKALLKLL